MKNILPAMTIVFSIIFLLLFGTEIIKENEVDAGMKVYENVKMSSAGNGGIILSEKDAVDLSKYIEKQHIKNWYSNLKGFILGLFTLLIGILASVKKDNNNST